MEYLLQLFGEYKEYVDIVAYAVLLASAIVKLTPTLKDDNFLLPVVKFIGKFIALNKYGPGDRK